MPVRGGVDGRLGASTTRGAGVLGGGPGSTAGGGGTTAAAGRRGSGSRAGETCVCGASSTTTGSGFTAASTTGAGGGGVGSRTTGAATSTGATTGATGATTGAASRSSPSKSRLPTLVEGGAAAPARLPFCERFADERGAGSTGIATAGGAGSTGRSERSVVVRCSEGGAAGTDATEISGSACEGADSGAGGGAMKGLDSGFAWMLTPREEPSADLRTTVPALDAGACGAIPECDAGPGPAAPDCDGALTGTSGSLARAFRFTTVGRILSSTTSGVF